MTIMDTPINLFYFEDKFVIGDFGLIDYPEKEDITGDEKKLGPLWTMAPEMRRDPANADGRCADVYSIAKTLWILLTGIEKGFEGQHNGESKFGLERYLENVYVDPIDKLIFDCTDNEPINRPNIDQFIQRLKKCKNDISEFQVIYKSFKSQYEEKPELNKSEFQKQNEQQWEKFLNDMFPNGIPDQAAWDDLKIIFDTLTKIYSVKDLTHTNLPGGGGVDPTGVNLSWEESCIELHAGIPIILKPKRLIFESFGEHYEWSHFRLELDELEPLSDIKVDTYLESLTEIEPGLYSDSYCKDFDDFNGKSLPESSRIIVRQLKGNLLIFQKTSPYNTNPNTYGGLFNDPNAQNYRRYFKIFMKKSYAENDTTKNLIKVPQYRNPDSFRGNKRILTLREAELIKNIIDLSKDFEFLNDEISFMEDSPQQIINQPERLRKLDGFLSDLSDEELLLLTAVYEGGRELQFKSMTYPLEEMIDYCSEQKQNRGQRINKITNGKPWENLEWGLKAYSSENGNFIR